MLNKDIGAYAQPQKLHLLVFDSGNSGAAQDGASVDSHPEYGPAGDKANAQAYRAGEVVIDLDAVSLTAAATAILDVQLQDSADDISFANVDSSLLMGTEHGAEAIPGAAALTLTGGGVESGQVKFGVELARLRRYVRVQVTVTLSNGADSVICAGYCSVGGGAIRPIDADKI